MANASRTVKKGAITGQASSPGLVLVVKILVLISRGIQG